MMDPSAVAVYLLFGVFAMWAWSRADRMWADGESTWLAREASRLLFVVLFALCSWAVMGVEDVLLALGINVMEFEGTASLLVLILLVSLAFGVSQLAQNAILRWQRRRRVRRVGGEP